MKVKRKSDGIFEEEERASCLFGESFLFVKLTDKF
jgi:hypothetical protein